MYCANCGSKLDERSRFCEYCGTEIIYTDTDQSFSDKAFSSQSYAGKSTSTQYSSTIEVNTQRSEYEHPNYPISPKSRLISLLLLLFLGSLGVHYFYAERIGMGILWLLTGGLFGIGLFIDLLVIITGNFKDSHGRPIVNWDL